MRTGPLFALLLAGLLLAPAAAAQITHPQSPVGQFTHTPLTAHEDLQALAAANPAFAEVRHFGQTVLGVPLYLIDIHHPDAVRAAIPVLYIDGNHHGNEQFGGETIWFFLEELMAWSLTEEGAARLADVRVVAAPFINADGTLLNQRTNMNRVDLNRNYPYNWGLYGTSDSPTGGTYRGPSAGSEPETQANIAVMRDVRPDLYFSTHTGSHDIVLPWRQTAEHDGPMPDWQAYEHFLAGIEDVSGLGYRDPSGAGESISWAYGALGAVSLIPEVDTTQSMPVTLEDLRERLKEEVAIYWYALEVLESVGGHLALQDRTATNIGWGNATQVTWHAGAELATPGATVVVAVAPEGGLLLAERLTPGESVQLPAGAGALVYERRQQGDEHRPTWAVQAVIPDGGDGGRPVPIGLLGALAALAATVLLSRRRAA